MRPRPQREPRSHRLRAALAGHARFTALGDERTRVELTQSNWEALGDVAEMVQGGYRHAWDAIFAAAYKTACGG